MKQFSLQFRDQMVDAVAQWGNTKFMQLSLHAGQGLAKHRTPYALAVVVLTGRIAFTIGEETRELGMGDMLLVHPNVEHEVIAQSQSTVLLVLSQDEPK
ncbi:hypothetical protein GCM10025857_07350 [Alicyclobacillus contaminans]|uniref:cupin domain-containing protein n=1 Tax=Alicyclobacillus contaminans TaxID=392016 RepID=UPI00041FD6C1|nr:cupin domain-containing protein [Alicyclobacillus contaminans]GMA49378.1 hypothetical protein GCM10025857_07350 [Alicyclobacillus contaminans]